ncbi:MAG: hypothetical protein RMM17_01290 [Acidobacteriota bacterium]|nr:hypothetical protein [Blastocatellia bacterium]MDW8411303.1 hypothetical protein [Acidobacteriota bacterium]
MRQQEDPNWKDILSLTALALAVPSTLAIPSIIGHIIDKHLSTNFFLFIGLLVGLLAAASEVININRRLKK